MTQDTEKTEPMRWCCTAPYGYHDEVCIENKVAAAVRDAVEKVRRDEVKPLMGLIQSLRPTHTTCEDSWYSCPRSEDGCANENAGDECNCGADVANGRIDEVLAAVRAAQGKEPKDETLMPPTPARVVWDEMMFAAQQPPAEPPLQQISQQFVDGPDDLNEAAQQAGKEQSNEH